MSIIGYILYIVGIALASNAGASHGPWQSIVVAGFVMAFGWMVIRAPVVIGVLREDGFLWMTGLCLIQVVLYSALSGVAYGVGWLLLG
jgi:hypothetical protein